MVVESDPAVSPSRSMWVRVTWIVLLVALAPIAVLAVTEEPDLLKMTLFAVPTALVLAWWLGFRIVRPIDLLRMQIAAKMNAAHPKPDLALPRRDELNQLARAFNSLLARLDERSHSNEAFVRDLTHELKNPIAAVRACVDPLRSPLLDHTRGQRLATVIEDSTQRLDALVSQLLELARAEAGMHNETRVPVDLVALVRGVSSVMQQDERWANVTFVIEAEGVAAVHGIPVQVESVVRNLLDNAVAFAGPRGTVTARVERGGDVITLSVSDSGPGIPAAEHARVFERFYTTRGERHGTGLGLALVRAIVEAHGGSVAVLAPPGEGATFEVSLPAG